MPSYFRQVPNFDYVSRLPDAKIGDYLQVKNLFKRGKLRDDIFQNLAFFEKYKIRGDDRPDNVAFKVYDDPSLDWVVLLSNNILNIQSEWPMTQSSFDEYLMKKYRTADISQMYFLDTRGVAVYSPEVIDEINRIRFTDDETVYQIIYNGVHHFETEEVKNSQGVVIVPKGLRVPNTYSVSYFDANINLQNTTRNIAVPVTNYEYEQSLENEKRNIYVLKQNYLSIVLNDMKDIMPYKKGSTQYVNETLKRADNAKLYS